MAIFGFEEARYEWSLMLNEFFIRKFQNATFDTLVENIALWFIDAI